MLSSIAASCTSQLVATTNGLHDDSPVRCLTSDAHFDGRDGQSLTPELTWPAAAEASPLQIGSLSQDWLLGAVAIGRSGRDAADLMRRGSIIAEAPEQL